MSTIRIDPYQVQCDILRAVSPGFIESDVLYEQLSVMMSEVDAEFDTRALLDTASLQVETMQNVDTILVFYQANMTAASANTYQAIKAEKDLIWAVLQLTARIQSVADDVGLVLNPMSEYLNRKQQLEICLELLEKAGIDVTEIKTFSDKFITKLPEALEEGAGWEKWFQDKLKEFDDRNGLRLFWVWAKMSLNLALTALDEHEAHERLVASTPIPNTLSWLLYFCRGSIYLYKFLKKRLNEPVWLKKLDDANLSTEEKAAYVAQYYALFWNVYKYRILNDLVFWGPINLACHGWLNGDGYFGWLGSVASVLLLCVDVSLVELKSKELHAENQNILKNYTAKELALSSAIFKKLEDENSPLLTIIKRAQTLEKKLNILDKYLLDIMIYEPAEEFVPYQDVWKQVTAWKDVCRSLDEYKRRSEQTMSAFDYDRFYTWVLLIAFLMSVAILFPQMLPALMTQYLHIDGIMFTAGLKAIGTLLCTIATIVHRVARAKLEISVQQEQKECLDVEAQFYADDIRKLNAIEAPSQYVIARKQTLSQLYDNAKLTSEHLSGCIRYQRAELLRTSFLRLVMPAAIGLWLVFAPALVAGIPSYFVLLVASALLSYGLARCTKSYKPNDLEIKPFQENAYNLRMKDSMFNARKVVNTDYMSTRTFSLRAASGGVKK